MHASRKTEPLGYSGPRMTSGSFLSTASVVTILACVALLTVVSTLALAPLEERLGRRRYSVAFACCLVGIWGLAVLAVTLIRRTI
jgi:hypothetical protein